FVVGLLLGCITVLAHAEGSVGAPAVQYVPGTYTVGSQFGSTPQEACQAWSVNIPNHSSIYPGLGGTGIPICYYTLEGSSSLRWSGQMFFTCPTGYSIDDSSGDFFNYQCKSLPNSCPVGSTLTNGECICNAGLKPYG